MGRDPLAVPATPTFGSMDPGPSAGMYRNQQSLAFGTTPFGRRGNSVAAQSTFATGSVRNSLQVMARGYSRVPAFGFRPVPSMLCGKTAKKRKSTETKSFRLTYVSDDNSFEDIWEIPIDLTKLQDTYGTHTLLNVVSEVENKLKIITDIKSARHEHNKR